MKKINRRKIYNALYKNTFCLDNRSLIYELHMNGSLDQLLSNISNNNIDIIGEAIYKKNKFNGLEQFFVNLDYFIFYVKKICLI